MSSPSRAVETLEIGSLTTDPEVVAMLAELLVETVAAGGSVSFMHPLATEEARAFWERSLAAAERSERIVLGAWMDGRIIGTVTLLLDFPPNQPHRAEIAKMMTLPDMRGRGIATALMARAEALAVEHDRTLLVLDTATQDGASQLYERVGFTFAGEIPDFALKPHGGLTGTRLYWKRIG
jgi:GNAT superfamily N-acetyltransferase